MPKKKHKRLLESLKSVFSDPSASLEQELQALQAELATSPLVGLRYIQPILALMWSTVFIDI